MDSRLRGNDIKGSGNDIREIGNDIKGNSNTKEKCSSFIIELSGFGSSHIIKYNLNHSSF